MSRIGKNARGVSGLVKKSARLAVLHTKGLYARLMDDLLSIDNAVGSVAARPRSANSERRGGDNLRFA
eukprot:1787451-Pleurochrysis_carterae.AAC.1